MTKRVIDSVTNVDVIIHNPHVLTYVMNIHKSKGLVLFAVSSFRLFQLEDRVQSVVLSFAHSGSRADRVNSLRRKEEKSFTMHNDPAVN